MRRVARVWAAVALVAAVPAAMAAFTSTTSAANTIATAADWTAPSVSSTVIAKQTGYLAGAIKQGGTYYVYANVADSGNPASGISTVKTDESAITSGQTAVNLTAGSYSVNGVSYNYRTAVQTAGNPLSGPKSYTITSTDALAYSRLQTGYTVTVDNTAPTATNVSTGNAGGGNHGLAEPGDTITFTFSEQIDPQSILAGWTGAATNVTVEFGDGGCLLVLCGSDTFSIPSLPFGSGESRQCRLLRLHRDRDHLRQDPGLLRQLADGGVGQHHHDHARDPQRRERVVQRCGRQQRHGLGLRHHALRRRRQRRLGEHLHRDRQRLRVLAPRYSPAVANWRSMVGRRAALARPSVAGDVLGRTPDWLWPYWVERQLDPESPSYIPRAPGPFPVNITHRNWTAVGNLASPSTAIVDPRGLVTPWVGGWSLDWWIGAEDRWHLPSRESAVRQSRVGADPGGGDRHAHPWRRRRPPGLRHPRQLRRRQGELVIVEVENQSAVPVAVAFALRPYNPDGLVGVGLIELDDLAVFVDGRRALLLPRPPAGVAASVLDAGDCVHRVTGGQATPGPLEVEDPEGLAQAAVVYPLPHRTTIRVAMPLAPDRPRDSGGLPRKHTRREALPAVDTTRWPAAARRRPRLAGPPPPRAAAGAPRLPAPSGGRRQPRRPAVVPHR